MSTPRTTTTLTRRGALAGVTTVGLGLPVLSACGDVGDAATSASDTESPSTGSSASTSEVTTGSQDPDAAAGIVSTADVPVGSGVIFADEQVVVTQPTQSEFRAFSAVCPHTGCTVNGISDIITCPCHGSTFDISTGEVLGGPAPSGLPAVGFTIDGDQVVLS